MASAVTPAIVVGALWILTHPATLPVLSSATANSSTIPNLAKWFAESLLVFPERLRQMFGVLGWLDTPIPGALCYLNIAAWQCS